MGSQDGPCLQCVSTKCNCRTAQLLIMVLPPVLQVYSGGLDNDVSVWELRKGAAAMKLKGHTHSITGTRAWSWYEKDSADKVITWLGLPFLTWLPLS
jgi:hypothetical protein